MTAVPMAAGNSGSSASANRSGGGRTGSSAFRMTVAGDSIKRLSPSSVEAGRGCGAAIVLDNAQWLDHNRYAGCVVYGGRPFWSC